MYEVPMAQPDPAFYRTKPSKLYRCFMVGMHCVNTWIIYMLWGWCPALLFAVHPQAVWGVAWVTGNYYATTAYFCLISYYILHAFPNIYGALVAMPIFAAALNSTICCVSFPFVFALTGNLWGCSLFIPLITYLKGKRFNAGIAIRDSFKANKPLKTPFTYKRFFLCVKVMGKYLTDSLYPNKLGLFAPYGYRLLDVGAIYDRYQAPNADFWKSLIVVAIVGIGGLFISPVGTVWLFMCLALHSQWRLTGQFYAQRYLYLAIIGLCVVIGIPLQSHPVLVAIIATFLFIRSHIFIEAFRNIECLLRNDAETFPESAQCQNSLAQFYMNASTPEKPLQAWRVNEIGSLLFKAEEMEPEDWAVKMNVACFFSIIGQWPVCLQKTTEALNLVKPLGGPTLPVEILEQQVKNVQEIIKQQGANVSPSQLPTPAGK